MNMGSIGGRHTHQIMTHRCRLAIDVLQTSHWNSSNSMSLFSTSSRRLGTQLPCRDAEDEAARLVAVEEVDGSRIRSFAASASSSAKICATIGARCCSLKRQNICMQMWQSNVNCRAAGNDLMRWKQNLASLSSQHGHCRHQI